MTRVAIVIPVWNDRGTLRRCLASLRQQTLQEFDVTIVDDGNVPPMDRFQISDSPPKAGPRQEDRFQIRWIRQPHAGAPVARNRGARETASEFLLFCDADIELALHALSRMVAELDAHPEASYAYSSFRFGWKTFSSFPFDAERLRRMPYIHTTSLIRRACFPGFDESLTRFQDWDLWLTLLERGHVGVHIPDVLFTIRNTRGTMSRWLPSLMYRLPWKSRRVREYGSAADIVRRKHQLTAIP